jgi:apolipoprotein N-acyltransferase
MTASAIWALLGGLTLSASFPPWNLDLAAWAAFVPFFWVINRRFTQTQAIFHGAIFGIAFFFVDLSWVYRTLILHGHFAGYSAALVFAGMVISLSIIPACFAAIINRLSRKGFSITVCAPFIWVSLECVRTNLFTGFPWDLLGYSQIRHLALCQICDITGVYGVTFLVVLVNGILYEALEALRSGNRYNVKAILGGALILLAAPAYGMIQLREYGGLKNATEGPSVAVLQGNIPQELKWETSNITNTFATYERLGHEAVKQGANFLIWPETSAPVFFGPHESGWKHVGLISERLETRMLVGAPTYIRVNGEDRYYNSAYLVDGMSLRDRYDKIHLVPFGEYMPLTWLLPLGPGIAAREADYSPGDRMNVIRLDGCPPFSVLICYEAIFPELSSTAVNNGAKLLINITNDGWFGDSAAPYQHLAMAGIRSIENRVTLIRAANTGISAVYDRSGKLVHSLPLNVEGFLCVKLPSNSMAGSFYSRHGDIFAWICILASAAALVQAAFISGQNEGPLS